MEKYFFTTILLIIFSFNPGFSQQYTPVERSSVIKFSVTHQMIFKSTVTGTFNRLKGNIIFDPKNIAQSSFNVSVAVETINSGIGMRDNDLKKEKYFDAEKFPRITIKSLSIARGAHENSYIFSGMLTMKDVTKTISFPFTAKPANGGYQFEGNFQLNRLDYNVGPDNSIDKQVLVDLFVIAK